MNPHIFVYGSLMAGIETKINRHFHKNSLFLGEGFAYGQLFDLGHYPGLVYSGFANQKVFGHIFELNKPAEMLHFLDEYENVGERYGQKNEYVRAEHPVFKGGKEIICHMYLYNLPTENLKLIASGNYFKCLKHNEKYRNFLKSV